MGSVSDVQTAAEGSQKPTHRNLVSLPKHALLPVYSLVGRPTPLKPQTTLLLANLYKSLSDLKVDPKYLTKSGVEVITGLFLITRLVERCGGRPARGNRHVCRRGPQLSIAFPEGLRD